VDKVHTELAKFYNKMMLADCNTGCENWAMEWVDWKHSTPYHISGSSNALKLKRSAQFWSNSWRNPWAMRQCRNPGVKEIIKYSEWTLARDTKKFYGSVVCSLNAHLFPSIRVPTFGRFSCFYQVTNVFSFACFYSIWRSTWTLSHYSCTYILLVQNAHSFKLHVHLMTCT
jgi:hypothetical protein